MITKWIQFRVAADSATAFRSSLAEVEIASKAEAGCAHYAAFQSQDDAAVFTVLESWDSEEAFEAHRQSPHIAVFKEQCAAMILEKSALSLDGVAS